MTKDQSVPEFAHRYVNLASPRLGSEAIFASDEFFAPKERMLQDAPAIFIADKYDDHGKWMDGWESRRRRGGGHDHCIVRLGVSAKIVGVDIDTAHFTGNFPPAASLEACLSDDPLAPDTEWQEILPAMSLKGDSHNFAEILSDKAYNAVRLNILPDGGVARLRLYGEPVCDWSDQGPEEAQEFSLLKNGGRIVAYNDAHYGTPWALLTEGRGQDMGDGWETRRRREPGHDWMIIQLGAACTVERLEIDTAFFKGNFPDRCSVQAAFMASGTDQSMITQAMFWPDLLAEQKMQADHIHTFAQDQLQDLGPVNFVKLNNIPDGGISRFRVFGKLARDAS